MVEIDEEFRQTLEANKREMFDGMRAYHESEIKHADHAITILISVAGAANAAEVALLSGANGVSEPKTAAFALFWIVSVLSLAIAWTTHVKIKGDNNVYRSYGQEYRRTCRALGLFETIGNDVVKVDGPIGEGEGYRKTQRIIWGFAFLVTGITGGLCGFVLRR